MEKSYNGWTASRSPAEFGGIDNRAIPGTDGVHYSPGIRSGAVAVIAFWWGWQWHTRIERLTPSIGCWGYYYKQSANSKSLLSAHSGGSAWDTAATKHPNGKRGTLNGPALEPGKTQLQVLREMLAYLEGVVYSGVDAWGGGTPDEMHGEMRTGTTQADADRIAKKILRDFGPIESWATRNPIAPTPTVPEDWFDMATEAQLEAVVLKVLRGEGVSGSGDADLMLSRGYRRGINEEITKVLRSEGVSGAGDLGRLTSAIRDALPQGQTYFSADDVEATVRRVFADAGAA